ncbi:2-succinyl-6-hydroxy-2,4-cyclohexadiene-1-carboxylate synthase [Bacillus sp. FSL K6-3431]|uniref:2-succinyl-6-hydroxy-2, 4-cyclohexadiene-1-carboxylate synthase n=1 Tax=Bacillus sp. FSL K6-3431 TaxID=2921500 RepID=UPI0030FC76D7
MIITVDELKYNVEVIGSGPPLILLHGFTGDITTWNNLAVQIKRKYSIISIDIIGHGQTDSPIDINRYEIEHVAHDIKSMMKELKIDQAHILGYSMGGRLALSFAMLYPQKVKSLILESSSPGLKTHEEREKRKQSDTLLAKRIIDEGMEVFVNFWEKIPLFSSQQQLPHDIQEHIRQQRLANTVHGLVNSLKGMGTGSQPSWWERLNDLHMPIKLVCGEQDEKFCKIAKEMQLKLSNAKLVVVKGVGHAIHVEEPEMFGTIVEGFLSEINEQ